MAYDDNAKRLAVKVIGTVESNLNYQAVNYNDPITVGIAQWYGTRAANILNRMRTTNAGEWYGVESSIANQLATIVASDPWWNSRYLTQTEGNSLTGVMGRNQVIQNTQLTEDLEAYKTVAISYGFDPETNTGVVIYFFSMHHQSPASALRVVQTLDTACTLDQMHAACLADTVFSRYGARYKTTYDLIMENDFSGVDPAAPPVVVPVQPNGNARLIVAQGDVMILQFENGEKVQFYPNGAGRYMPNRAQDAPAEPNPADPPPPVDSGTWVLPLTGDVSLTSAYGPRAFDGIASFHYGIDLATTGSAGNVVSPCPLVITVAWESGTPGDPSQGTAGSYVKGHTTDGAYTFNFYHMVPGSIAVSVGQTTTTGQVIGVEGDSGNAYGTHLHFEAYAGNFTSPWPPPYGQTTDPLVILRAHGVAI